MENFYFPCFLVPFHVVHTFQKVLRNRFDPLFERNGIVSICVAWHNSSMDTRCIRNKKIRIVSVRHTKCEHSHNFVAPLMVSLFLSLTRFERFSGNLLLRFSQNREIFFPRKLLAINVACVTRWGKKWNLKHYLNCN